MRTTHLFTPSYLYLTTENGVVYQIPVKSLLEKDVSIFFELKSKRRPYKALLEYSSKQLIGFGEDATVRFSNLMKQVILFTIGLRCRIFSVLVGMGK